ncbi:MAG: glycosyltransferase family 4 protein [Bacteroidota bacterium]
MGSKLKIFLISNMYPSPTDPLFGVFVKNFVTRLDQLGVSFTEQAVIKGKTPNPLFKLFRYISYYVQVFKKFRRNNYNLIYVHFLSHNAPILWFLYQLFPKKKPLIINVHGSDVVKSKGNFIDKFNRKVLKKCDLLVVPSPSFKETVAQQYPFLNVQQIMVSPSGGIDTKHFFPKKDKSFSVKLHIGMVSRIDPQKGWQDFLEALRILKNREVDFSAQILGSGTQDEACQAMIKEFELEEKVVFSGLIPHQNLVDFFHTFDVAVFPSTNQNESLGLVGLEAMSCGIPVIGSKIPSIKSYLKHGKNGFLFETAKAKGLANRLMDFQSLPIEEKIKMQKQARTTALNFDAEKISKQLVKKLNEYVE